MELFFTESIFCKFVIFKKFCGIKFHEYEAQKFAKINSAKINPFKVIDNRYQRKDLPIIALYTLVEVNAILAGESLVAVGFFLPIRFIFDIS